MTMCKLFLQLQLAIIVYILFGTMGLILLCGLYAYDLKLSRTPRIKTRVIHHYHTD